MSEPRLGRCGLAEAYSLLFPNGCFRFAQEITDKGPVPPLVVTALGVALGMARNQFADGGQLSVGPLDVAKSLCGHGGDAMDAGMAVRPHGVFVGEKQIRPFEGFLEIALAVFVKCQVQ